jgi:hypothetical protein
LRDSQGPHFSSREPKGKKNPPLCRPAKADQGSKGGSVFLLSVHVTVHPGIFEQPTGTPAQIRPVLKLHLKVFFEIRSRKVQLRFEKFTHYRIIVRFFYDK